MHFFVLFSTTILYLGVSWCKVRTQDSGGGRGQSKIPKILLSFNRLLRVI